MFNKDNYKIFSTILIFLSFFSFLVGFYFDENSAGAGTYKGDFSFIWKNIQIFITHDLITAIKHQDYFTNRPPLLFLDTTIPSYHCPSFSIQTFLLDSISCCMNWYILYV